MLDHVFADAIGALRAALELALLERQATEERFTTDALLGDTRWETSYSIPGESDPPQVQADITLLWPTWSQTAYRSWYLTGDLALIPAIDAEVVVRAQGLTSAPDVASVLASLPDESPEMGVDTLVRAAGATVEAMHDDEGQLIAHALEVSYEGSFELPSELLADGNRLDELFSATGSWISSTLITLSDSI